MMSDIEPANARLVFGAQVNQKAFKCCQQPDGLLFRCPSCFHIWGVCMDCDNWTPDLNDSSTFRLFYNFLKKDGGPGSCCPHCAKMVFDEENWFDPGVVDKYLPLPDQVVKAGFSYYLNSDVA